jgi:hypothetical protein
MEIKDKDLPILVPADNIDTTAIDALSQPEINQKIIDRGIIDKTNQQLVELAEQYPQAMIEAINFSNMTYATKSDIEEINAWAIRIKEKYALVLQEIASRRKAAIALIDEEPIEEP